MPIRMPLSHDRLPEDVTDRFTWRHRVDAPASRPAGRFPLAALAGFALTGVIIVVAVILFARNPALDTTQTVASGKPQTSLATPASIVAAQEATPAPTPAAASASLATTSAALATRQSAAPTTRRLFGGPKPTATTGAGRDDAVAAATTCRNSPIAQYLLRHGLPLPC
ncbi:hypothetical protein FraEuI1c_0029 [Pseudofrankia inefficax]|uniref:Uncharacterized protein n=2 Tax=Pseudofrankia inefficax (strain DSM 45817 / CECT 9037 / DDB 130130 / EuI1c) TaxID=298654 RepID=E3J279_PSEI1|nr:hypothetical protein FraEuI1c_0029 [Pseudofrankia inefficax]